MISAGGALTRIGTAVALNDLEEDLGNIFDPHAKKSNDNETLASVLVLTGVAAMVTSIFFFISS
ncbi:MAG: hypothetical protein ABIQ31_12965 [Ferruginibacter sp.]